MRRPSPESRRSLDGHLSTKHRLRHPSLDARRSRRLLLCPGGRRLQEPRLATLRRWIVGLPWRECRLLPIRRPTKGCRPLWQLHRAKSHLPSRNEHPWFECWHHPPILPHPVRTALERRSNPPLRLGSPRRLSNSILRVRSARRRTLLPPRKAAGKKREWDACDGS